MFPLLWCGTCAACEQGKYVQCHDYDYLGSRSDGAFAEYVVAPKAEFDRCIHARRDTRGSSDDRTGCSCTYTPSVVRKHRLLEKLAAIFGAGPIGLMTAQWARIMGATTVLLFDIVAEKLELAKQLGFDEVFNTTQLKNPLKS